MGDDQERGAARALTVAHQLEDGLGADFVSRLPVGSSARTSERLHRQRARDRDALLLAAGHVASPVVAPRREPDALEQRVRPLSASRRRAGRASTSIGIITFSSAVNAGIR